MNIEELPDRKVPFYETNDLRNEPLLEYVW